MGKRPANPIHPGTYIRDELAARNWSVERLETKTGIPRDAINKLIRGKLPVDERVAERLAKAFGTSAQTWLNLQKSFMESLRARIVWRARKVVDECDQAIRDANYWNGLPHNQKHTPLDVEDFRVTRAAYVKVLEQFGEKA